VTLAAVWMSGDVGYRLSTGQDWGWAGIASALAWAAMLWTSLSGGAAAFLQTHVSQWEFQSSWSQQQC